MKIKEVIVDGIDIKKLLSWSRISKITGRDRGTIRSNLPIPKKAIPMFDKLFLEQIPEWWNEYKAQFIKPPKQTDRTQSPDQSAPV